jgi:CRP-like cAMP-binding protein
MGAVDHPGTLTVRPALADAPIFADLSDAEREAIAGLFRPRRFPRDAALLLEGDPAEVYYLLAEGQVKVVQTSAEGVEVILHLLGPGDLLGALPNLDEGTYPASAIALTQVVAYAVSPRDFEAILERHPSAALFLLRFAASRLRSSQARLRELATERVERRIARTLSRLAPQIGQRTERGVVLNAPLSRQDLAEMAGTTLFTVSRTLKDWERRGIVIAGRSPLTILNTHALVAIGEDIPS